MNNFVNSFNPSVRVPGTMKRRVFSNSVGDVVVGVTTPEVAQQVVAGLSADQVFDLPQHGDGVRRTAVQGWWTNSQLKVTLLPESTSHKTLLLQRAREVLAGLGKEEVVGDKK